MIVFVIASKPYVEKIIDDRFYLDYQDAKDRLAEMPDDIRGNFKIYKCLLHCMLETFEVER